MMATRTIPVSTDLYAAIWRAQKPGEESEEDILRRILGIPLERPTTLASPGSIGFRDPRFGLELPEGFEVFRVYKGLEYRAKATAGQWLLMNTGDMHPSLNQLSRAVTGRTENAWICWYYLDKRGKRQLMNTLRKG
jgi:hypothetical protein